MKKSNIKNMAGILMLVLVISVFTGCRVADTNVYVSLGSGSWHAFMIGNDKCPQNEAALYVSAFADFFSAQKGTEEWIKSSAINLISRVYSLNVYARDNDIELTSDEKDSVKKAAEEFYSMLEADDIKKLDISESDLEGIYERYALSLKVYNFITTQADSEISEDEARVIDAYVIHVTDSQKADEIDERLASGDDFATLVQVYTDGDKRQISFSRGTYPEAVDEQAFFLENGKTSTRIDTPEGIYYVKCVNKYNELESERNRQSIITQRQKTLIDQIIEEQSEKYYTSLNQDFFDEIDIEDIRITNGEKIFYVIESYL